MTRVQPSSCHGPARPDTPGGVPARLRVGVVGAGVAGLAAARRLARAGCDVQVFEKSRGPGGRTATRRSDHGGAFDHGAPSFGAHDARFVALLAEAEAAGAVARYVPRVAESCHRGIRTREATRQRWVGVPGMNGLCRWLAQGLDLHAGARVTRLAPTARGVELACADGGPLGCFDRVLVSVPGPQAVPLLEAAPALAARAAALAYEPCFTLMLGLCGPREALPPALRDHDALRPSQGPLDWALRVASKPGRASREAWVLYARADWSAQRLEGDPEAAGAELLAALEAVVGPLPGVVERVPMRWRYARAIPGSAGEPALLDEATGLGLCGDALAGARVEAAWRSGEALADAVLRARGVVA